MTSPFINLFVKEYLNMEEEEVKRIQGYSTGTYLMPFAYKGVLTDGQICSWRMNSVESAGERNYISFRDTCDLMDIDHADVGKFSRYYMGLDVLVRYIFVIIDSCSLVRNTIESIIADVRSMYGEEVHIVIVPTLTTFAEARYKLQNPGSYRNIDFDLLKSNVGILRGSFVDEEGSVNMLDVGVSIIQFPIDDENQIAINIEKFFANRDDYFSMRNEINDDILAATALDLAKIFKLSGSFVLVYTRDRGLIGKLNNYSDEGVFAINK